jgi:dephospho-CoA kinase
MKVIGITGGIASGKTTVDQMILKEGYKVIDSDKIAHELLKEPSVISKLIETFGSEIVENGSVNRKQLGELTFRYPAKLQQLNSIVHPLVKMRIRRNSPGTPWNSSFLLMYPFYMKLIWKREFDYVIVIYIPDKITIGTFDESDDITCEYAIPKLSRQLSLKKKITKADFIVYNDGHT